MTTAKSMKDALKDLPPLDIVDKPEEILPACATCQDTGYVRYNLPQEDKNFGKMFHCPEPNCAVAMAHRRQQAEVVMKHSTWEEDYADLTFESFWNLLNESDAWDGKRGAFSVANMWAVNRGIPFTQNEASVHVLKTEWPKADPRPSNWVVLTGDVGVGKTGLGVSAANLLRELNEVVVFIRMMDLIRAIQMTYSKPNSTQETDETTSDRYRFFNTVKFLILDEFGIKNYSPDRLEIVETIIRARDRAGLPTLITTNITLEEISERDKWDKQIGDILKKSHWVQIGGKKLRQTREKVQTW